MKALQKIRPAFGLELRDIAQPELPGAGEVIVEVQATGLCGTDLHIYEWTSGYERSALRHPTTQRQPARADLRRRWHAE